MTDTSAEQLAAAAWQLHKSGRLGEAIDLYRQAAQQAPDYAEIHNNLGNALQAVGKLDDAAASLALAIRLKPDLASAHSNLGLILAKVGRLEEAAQCHRRALALYPALAPAHNNLGIALLELRQATEAASCFRRALQLDPKLAVAYANLGDALRLLEKQQKSRDVRDRYLSEAIENYRRAIALRPSFAEAYANMGDAQARLRQLPESAASFRRALELRPGYGQALAHYVARQRQMCEWRDEMPLTPAFIAAASTDDKGAIAFPFLTIADDPGLQLLMARHDSRVLADAPGAPPWQEKRDGHGRIRLAYLSSDFHEHPTAYLIAELFELHDRRQFEVFGFSYGPPDDSPMRQRLIKALDHFVDVSALSDADVAAGLREQEIDIAVDLKGFTQNSRPRILAFRPAPIQVSYLGYPGSMGAPFIDYAIVDQFVVPQGERTNFDEKLAYLPHSYQVNDSKRKIGDRVLSRSDYGLPEQGFVFCCFNNNYKISPAMFSLWMDLLRIVPASVLWLFADNRWAIDNLRREAQSRGVDADRLVFAGHVSLPEHLARHQVADLFVDTLPCTAHTTASDALWAGLPVLTCAGQSFAARVAGSLLHAIGLPELVAVDLEEYKAKALELAEQPERLRTIKEKLRRNRLTMPLFDSARFCRHIEAAFRQMWSLRQEGYPPRSFAVPPAD